jgi:hypothetical protein
LKWDFPLRLSSTTGVDPFFEIQAIFVLRHSFATHFCQSATCFFPAQMRAAPFHSSS